ncbi:GATOR complex protein Wdr59 [Bradysia coprophila]|uniref:GATOR complex protein Wdr59 n=1 Tax=Bradysia coprophila TaxID=38358 RepID=UPI00187D7994|nr:GATOR complex protein Wdr59 [Bradysia coprophila]
MSSYSEIFMKEPTSCFSRQSSWYSTEHRDLQATAMSLDWSGQFILLAGRRHLALQSLDKFDDDEDSLRKFYRNSKHEVSSAEWAICEHSQEYCALATSQLIEVITWRSGHPTLIHSLRAHTRVITDIDWHMKHPHLLASCSIDTFTHLWDLRDPRKPILSLSAVCMSGATQVGFNRVSGNLLATAHDGDLRIWDQRMGSCPIQYITAHLSRIHGINWSHYYETHLTTASQDGTVKYFDINNPRRAERIITTSSPVWRARYTPFADGLVTVIVPHLGRGENSLLLWNNSKQSAPICSFVGHTDVVLDFAWRPKRNQSSSDMELITWSRDQSVRVWRIDEALQKQCESPQPEDDAFESSNRLNVPSKPSRNRTQPSCSLQHEFSLLNTNIPHIDVEVLDPIKRNATLRITVNGLVIMLQVTFPITYPDSQIPDFAYCQGTNIDINLSDSLMKVLKTSATQRTKNGRPCLEFCLRALVTAFKKATNAGDKTNIRLQSPRLEGALSGCVMDACVPFPRTSGARFNHVGILVTFSQVINSKGISLKHQNTTPRALSALSGGYLGNVMGSQPVLYAHHRDANSTAFYLHDRVRKSTKNRVVLPKPSSPSVLVYDVSKILFVSRDLAENYIIDSKNVAYMCRHNKEIAQQFGYPEIAQCWELAEIVAATTNETESESDDMVFNQIPFPKNILESLILHHAQNYDIQTAAMICCAFGRHCPQNELSRTSSLSNKSNQSHIRSGQRIFKQSGSPYHTILPVDSKTNQSWGAALYKQFRSNSWSDSLDECRTGFELNRTILGDSQRHLYDNFKRAYSEMLYRWGLLVNRTKVLKYLSSSSDTFRGVEFVTECIKCAKVTQAPMCRDCHKPLLYCSLCRLPVRGSANSCLFCGHGGHLLHMKQWFEKNEVCATGCGCYCLKESSKLVEL